MIKQMVQEELDSIERDKKKVELLEKLASKIDDEDSSVEN